MISIISSEKHMFWGADVKHAFKIRLKSHLKTERFEPLNKAETLRRFSLCPRFLHSSNLESIYIEFSKILKLLKIAKKYILALFNFLRGRRRPL